MKLVYRVVHARCPVLREITASILSPVLQDLATHIGEVVINKSFCTRRNPISISAAAIYLACQLEDKRKTQTEICKATGLTEVGSCWWEAFCESQSDNRKVVCLKARLDANMQEVSCWPVCVSMLRVFLCSHSRSLCVKSTRSCLRT